MEGVRSNDLGQTRPVDATARRWVQHVMGPGTAVHDAAPFRHGSSSEVTALDVIDPGGGRRALVLRRFVDDAWLAREPDLAAREAAVLDVLTRSPVPTPELVAVDPTGADAGAPAVLTGRLPGDVVVTPVDRGPWLQGLAELLARIHETPIPPGLRAYRPWYATTRSLAPPPWSRDPSAWRTAITRARAPVPAGTPVFLHRDFQPTNVLWLEGRVSGVVDWVEASAGPAGADLGHCRCNLAMDLGLDAADALRAVVGAAEYDPYWDLISAVDFLPDLDVAQLPSVALERLDAFVAAAVARL
jgi:aminoglycoside phosphotransferase (APT) family kinase protein